MADPETPRLTPNGRRRIRQQLNEPATSGVNRAAALALLDEVDDLCAELDAERTRREQAEAIVAKVNNSIFGSDNYFTTPSCVDEIENLKAACHEVEAERDDLRRQLTEAEGKWTALREWLTQVKPYEIPDMVRHKMNQLDAKEPQA